jgi:hypothetical protein
MIVFYLLGQTIFEINWRVKMPQKFGTTSGTLKLSPNQIGSLGEQIVEMLLTKEGYKVRPFRKVLYPDALCSNFEALCDACRKSCKYPVEQTPCTRNMSHTSIWSHCKESLSQHCSQVCNKFCTSGKINRIFIEVGDESTNKNRGSLDFVAYKDGKTYVVEVKTGTHPELKSSQKQFVERLRHEVGIELLHFHVTLNNEIDYSVRCTQNVKNDCAMF